MVTARVIEALGIEGSNVMRWSMGGFIAQAFALKHANRVDKLVLLSTDSAGMEADLALPDVWSELLDTSATPNEQARRFCSCFFQTTSPNIFTFNSARSWSPAASSRACEDAPLLRNQSSRTGG